MKHKFFYSVWVGGVEVNDFPLTIGKALRLAQEYIEDGYDDVALKEYNL